MTELYILSQTWNASYKQNWSCQRVSSYSQIGLAESYILLFPHMSLSTESSGKIHLPSTQSASLLPTALSWTSWRGRRWWLSEWESAVASAKLLHGMKSSSSWQFSSKSCTLPLLLDRHWTWPQSTDSQWNTNAVMWQPHCVYRMRSKAFQICMTLLVV